jgi:uncharacterized membrane protein YeaQ/YmgE (transglycosylase-associated protein family)
MKSNDLLAHPLNRLSAALTLAVAVFAMCFCPALNTVAAESVGDKVSAAASEAEKQVTEASQAAESKMQELWRRIDERRLMNRTPDQLVAWIIMGLLTGGLIHQLSKLNRFATLLIGLAGAFLGGILANVIQLDLGFGPVLIRYEDLLASLLGAVVIVLAARWLASRRSKSAPGK